jgi:hypothetical protein
VILKMLFARVYNALWAQQAANMVGAKGRGWFGHFKDSCQ